LGELVLDVELPTTQGQRTRCGSCTRCLDACPTSAFVDEFSLDARRCISYLTIEYRGVVPLELRPLMGQWVFGCDICQTVCPFNASKKPRPVAPELAGERTELDLGELLSIGSAAHRRLVAGTALRRAPRWQLMRNAAIALGNETQAQGRAIEILTAGLAQNRYPLVRGHIAWALGRLGATQVLFDHQDEDPYVRSEIEEALHPAS
ncbi:MAG: 4Fe-4S double cluster binding domain-containing protein, partial [Myxococcota bacterium]